MKSSALLVALALSLASAPCFAQDTVEEAPLYPPSSVRPKLIGGGLAITAISYGVGFVVATSWPDAPGAESLKYPIVGPWMALAENKCSTPGADDCASQVWLRGILTTIGGVAQLGGLALVTEALVMKTQAVAPAPAETGKFIMPYPIITTNGGGLGLIGTF